MSIKSFIFPRNFSERKAQEKVNALILFFCMGATSVIVFYVMFSQISFFIARERWLLSVMFFTALGAMIVSAFSLKFYRLAERSNSFNELKKMKYQTYKVTLIYFFIPAMSIVSWLLAKRYFTDACFMICIFCLSLGCYVYDWKTLLKLENKSKELR